MPVREPANRRIKILGFQVADRSNREYGFRYKPVPEQGAFQGHIGWRIYFTCDQEELFLIRYLFAKAIETIPQFFDIPLFLPAKQVVSIKSGENLFDLSHGNNRELLKGMLEVQKFHFYFSTKIEIFRNKIIICSKIKRTGDYELADTSRFVALLNHEV